MCMLYMWNIAALIFRKFMPRFYQITLLKIVKTHSTYHTVFLLQFLFNSAEYLSVKKFVDLVHFDLGIGVG